MQQDQADRIEQLLKDLRSDMKGLPERVARLETQAGYFQLALGFLISGAMAALTWFAKKGT